MKGVRGEALSGYCTVLKLALPVLKDFIQKGFSINDAGAMTLLHILAYSEDTNIVNRSSYEEMKEIQKILRKKLDIPAFKSKDYLAYLKKLDRNFIQRNISPGGSADLLALTYFIYLYEKSIGKS
jgi:holo-ACP synthase/triphosphoribosyl-dephospho-CoA synthase